MTDKYEEVLKCFDDGCMGEHIHEWCNGDGMQQARSGVYGFEFAVEQIETIRQALKLASVAQEMAEFLTDRIRMEWELSVPNITVDEFNLKHEKELQAIAKYKEING